MPYQDKEQHRTGIGAKFPLGRTVYSDAIATIVAGDPLAAMSLNTFLRFHQSGRWSGVSSENARANERALADGGAIVSCYELQGHSIVIVTGPVPRETTRVLLRDEYESDPDGVISAS
jgi:hypothetical protein